MGSDPQISAEAAVSTASEAEPAAPAGGAPSEATARESWRFSLTPYMWVPALSGTIGIRGKSFDVDVTQGDAFDALSDLDGAFSLHFEAGYGRISLFLDGMYYGIKQDRTDRLGGAVQAKVEQGLFEVGAAYRLLDLEFDEAGTTRFVLEPLGGVRVYYAENSLQADSIAVDASEDAAWANVIVGARGRVSILDGAVGLFGRGDFGFGASSDTAWNAIVGLDVRLANWCSILGGYRWLNIDYENERSGGTFTYDALEQGPFLAAEFRF